MTRKTFITRRTLLSTGAAASAMTLAAPGILRAQSFPERNISVYIPTREGGGADRNFRAFTSVWKEKLGTDFEPGFYPGASGRVGYEIYMGKAEPDCYSLIFGNMGPEVLNWAMQEPTFDINDYFYFGRVDVDPSCLFVGAESPFQTMDAIIEEAQKRTMTVGTSRMAHPASIGLLALGEKTGASFNLIPLSGGKNTVAGAVTGEVDFSVLTSGSVVAAGDAVKTLLVFGENRVGERLDNAPGINEAFDMNLPEMLSARAFGIHRAAAEQYPDRYARLQETFAASFEDPALLEAYVATGGAPEYLSYGGVEECAQFMKDMLELGAKYKPLLTGA
ncbi:tripartite tricarboxylate transporter substrate-binding protein [Aestuariicoccus sp. MJ-SS9]|uniref:tripartite tricarboxylate transporter substrate-binding protein n=1 Tax=Aestuariicoccus sp. MJ-SS9 TaxID=3079855 RepID=UPI00290CEFEC|nr:tripartite tricarboxylate transporter substrate-binding protein [Aestuariicoccus sp. MJ-SS9]MDU8911926.1 tripartite tricarboxylate transporter substrate-binding protein [Aestuariicoccus sp. MJ-SS9]